MKAVYLKKLLQEYADYGMQPQKIVINHEEMIIPAEYALSGSKEDSHKSFLANYFDAQKYELNRYRKAGVQPRKIRLNGMSFVVPFRWRNNNKLKDAEIVDSILKRAKAKYTRAVSLAQKLSVAFPNKKYTVGVSSIQVRRMQTEYNRYVLEKCGDKAKYALAKAGEMIVSGVRSLSKKRASFNISKLRNNVKALGVSGIVLGASFVTGYTSFGGSKDEKQELKKEFALKDVPSNEIGPVPVKIVEFERSDVQKNKLFDTFTAKIFESEGGYADKKIDQPTNMGIIQSTLDAYKERFPDKAKQLKFPETVKELSKKQAKEIYHQLYFNHYKIGEYRNESIGLLLYDAYVNHQPSTVRKFVDEALTAANQSGAKVELPTSTPERVAAINALADTPEAEAVFYHQLLASRWNHMVEKTTGNKKQPSRFAKGLKKRVAKFEDKYVATGIQEKATQLCLSNSSKFARL